MPLNPPTPRLDMPPVVDVAFLDFPAAPLGAQRVYTFTQVIFRVISEMSRNKKG